eukprot:1341734-Amorphochlora_amoeboformis.AAC.1
MAHEAVRNSQTCRLLIVRLAGTSNAGSAVYARGSRSLPPGPRRPASVAQTRHIRFRNHFARPMTKFPPSGSCLDCSTDCCSGQDHETSDIRNLRRP